MKKIKSQGIEAIVIRLWNQKDLIDAEILALTNCIPMGYLLRHFLSTDHMPGIVLSLRDTKMNKTKFLSPEVY